MNISQQHDEALEANVIGAVILRFMEERDTWEGTPSELLSELTPVAEALHVLTNAGFPKNPRWVTRRVKEVRVNLKEKGIVCAFSKSGPRKITLAKVGAVHDHDVLDVQRTVAAR